MVWLWACSLLWTVQRHTIGTGEGDWEVGCESPGGREWGQEQLTPWSITRGGKKTSRGLRGGSLAAGMAGLLPLGYSPWSLGQCMASGSWWGRLPLETGSQGKGWQDDGHRQPRGGRRGLGPPQPRVFLLPSVSIEGLVRAESQTPRSNLTFPSLHLLSREDLSLLLSVVPDI